MYDYYKGKQMVKAVHARLCKEEMALVDMTSATKFMEEVERRKRKLNESRMSTLRRLRPPQRLLGHTSFQHDVQALEPVVTRHLSRMYDYYKGKQVVRTVAARL